MEKLIRNLFNIDNILRKKAKKKGFFFIQIGSHDGITGDPIYNYIIEYNWHGILIEPVKDIFKKLLKNYKNKNHLYFENVAISNTNGIKKFYRLKNINNRELPIWFDQLGSFYIDVILNHEKKIPNIRELIVEEEVDCITFSNLIEKYKVSKIDLLHIDTEGYDYQIIKTIKFDNVIPKIIFFEYKHLSKEDWRNCLRLLRRQGYIIIKKELNAFAFRPLFHIRSLILFLEKISIILKKWKKYVLKTKFKIILILYKED